MAQKPIAMELLKQILQLRDDGVGIREMARRSGISRNSVRKYLRQLEAESSNVGATELAEKAYTNDTLAHDAQRFEQLMIHFRYAEEELSKTGVTRQLLWQEYMQQHPDGYVYSHYCHHLNQYLKNKDLSMHLEYEPGDIVMIDFAGKKLHYVDDI